MNKKEYDKRYYQIHKKRLLASSKKYKSSHKEESKVYFKTYSQKNKQRISKYQKDYYKKYKTQILARNLKYAKAHPEIMKKVRRKFYLERPDLILWYSIKSRCKIKILSKLNISRGSFINWYNSQKKICIYCNITEANWQKGKDSLRKLYYRLQVDRKNNNIGYSLRNIVLACPRCNLIKSDFFDYKQMLKIGRIVNAIN